MEGQQMTERTFCFYESLMQPDGADYPLDSICDGCRYHEPDWEYRFCRFTECPGIQGFKTFREEYERRCMVNGGI